MDPLGGGGPSRLATLGLGLGSYLGRLKVVEIRLEVSGGYFQGIGSGRQLKAVRVGVGVKALPPLWPPHGRRLGN